MITHHHHLGLYFEANFDLFTSISWLDYINGTRNYENLVLPNLKVVVSQREPVYSTYVGFEWTCTFML